MIREPSPRALVLATAGGGVLVAAASYWVAAFPFSFRAAPPPVVDLMAPQAAPARIAFYLGLAAMCLAWLGLGRMLWRGDDLDARTLRAAGLAGAVPMLVATPLLSRDLWAYVAQARIAAAGLDPYAVSPLRFGPSVADDVSARWVDSVSPYGPLWTVLGRGAAALTGDDTVLALVLRLPAFVGFVLLATTVPALARRVGVAPALPVWLVVANPMVVVHGVGGGHNDTLMVGLVAAGLLAALAGGPRWRALLLAGVLVGAAAAIKIPAVVAAPFLPLLAGRRHVVTGLTWAVLGTLAALVAATLAAGRGLAWLAAANTDDHGGGPALTVALAVVLVALWCAALSRSPWPFLAAALLAPALLSKLSLAWYWFWPLVPAALVLRSREATFVVAVGSVSTVFFVRPNGQNAAIRPEFVIVLVAVVAWWVLDRHWRPLTRHPVPVETTVEQLR